jgi:hypothetical protein
VKKGVKLKNSGNSSQIVIWKRPFFITSYIGGDSSFHSQLTLRKDGCREKVRNNGCMHQGVHS